MWLELNRVIKDNGAIVLFGGEPFSSHLRTSNLGMFKYDWYWNKSSNSGFVNAKLKPMNTVETISVFSKGKTSNGNKNNMLYFPQGLLPYGKITKNGNKPTKENSPGRTNNKSSNGGYLQEFTNYPKNYLSFDMVRAGAVHPTQKPVALLEYLIKTYTLENETVLDFTMGSGSTGIACINTKRKFIGIEKDDKYFQVAKDRIDSRILDHCEEVSNFAPAI
jgi:site-specific DNA-methyltransferase (adenine-specific)